MCFLFYNYFVFSLIWQWQDSHDLKHPFEANLPICMTVLINSAFWRNPLCVHEAAYFRYDTVHFELSNTALFYFTYRKWSMDDLKFS